MLAEALAVVRGDDHPGPIEDRARSELVEQSAELLVEVRDAVVVGVADEREIPRRDRSCPSSTSPGSVATRGRSLGLTPKRWIPPAGADRGVGVVIIQEGEERPLRLAAPASQSRNSRLTTAACLRSR